MTFPTPTELDTRLLPTLHETLESEGTAQWSMKPDGSPVTELDHALQEAVIGVLRQLTPDYPVLGEEMDAEDPLFVLYTSGSTGKPASLSTLLISASPTEP